MAKGDFIESSPAGNSPANQIDDNVTRNQIAMRETIDTEHVMGSPAGAVAQSGRHKFGIGTTAQRDAISEWPDNGAVWFNTEVVAGKWFIQVRVSGAWQAAGITPAIPTQWASPQSGTYADLATVTGNVVPNFSNMGSKMIVGAGGITFQNPINLPSGTRPFIYHHLEIRQDGVGGRSVAFADPSLYDFDAAREPVFSSGANEVDIVQLFLKSDGRIHVSLVASNSST